MPQEFSPSAVVGYIDLLGAKESARLGKHSFDQMLQRFYQELIVQFNAVEDPRFIVRAFGDAAYFQMTLDDEGVKRLNIFRKRMFGESCYFKCAIVPGVISETSLLDVMQAQKNDSSATEEPGQSFARSLGKATHLRDLLLQLDDSRRASILGRCSLYYFGEAATQAFNLHERFKGVGYSLDKLIWGGGELPRQVVRTVFPSSVHPRGYLWTYDLRFEDPITSILLYSRTKREGTGKDVFPDSGYESQEFKALKNLLPEPPLQSSLFSLDRLVDLQQTYWAGQISRDVLYALGKKKEYVTYYISTLVTLVSSSDFRFIYFSKESAQWFYYPNLFKVWFLEDGFVTTIAQLPVCRILLSSFCKAYFSAASVKRRLARSSDDHALVTRLVEDTNSEFVSRLYRIDPSGNFLHDPSLAMLSDDESDELRHAVARHKIP